MVEGGRAVREIVAISISGEGGQMRKVMGRKGRRAEGGGGPHQVLTLIDK